MIIASVSTISAYLAAALGLIGLYFGAVSLVERFEKHQNALNKMAFVSLALATVIGFLSQAGAFADIDSVVLWTVSGLVVVIVVGITLWLALDSRASADDVQAAGDQDAEGKEQEHGSS